MAKKSSDTTPMMRQYLDIKKKYPHTFLFFRMGDFYEMFFEDAEKASKLLGITLTQRGSHQGKEIPMCGVPYHSVDSYLEKMMVANQKVAICEQVEDPKLAKGIVKRDVLRVITPGTLIDDSLLGGHESNYLVAFCKAGALFGLAFGELSTGEFQVTELSGEANLYTELTRINPREILVPMEMEALVKEMDFYSRIESKVLFRSDWTFDFNGALQLLTSHFKTHSLDGFGLGESVSGISASGALLNYVEENCPKALKHLSRIKKYNVDEFMTLDETTKRNLELLETPNNPEGTTLVDILNFTSTPMGARCLKQWLNAPLKNLEDIQRRLESVSELKENYELRGELFTLLKDMGDLERMMGRITCGNALPRDLLGLAYALKKMPSLRSILNQASSSLLAEAKSAFIDFDEVLDKIEKAIDPDAPNILKDGGVIRHGYHSELDELIDISLNAKEKLTQIQQEEIKKTGIKNLKIKFNNVFGYYLEVSKGQTNLVPDYFIRKQTLVNAERYITPELKELESKILGAEQKSVALEIKLFNELKEDIAVYSNQVKNAAIKLAEVDTLLSLGEASSRYDYSCPHVHDGDEIMIEEGRHPVVERLLPSGQFINNCTRMNEDEDQILLITGPNMAGKSTYLRQVALHSLLAQVGSHVPAAKASLGIVDRIFTRVGASDDLSSGKSTFMVEMNETSNILNNATHKSLIILDEIGRGTSTYDGISIAWAVLEYLTYQSNVKAKTLFATHYHELTVLENKLKGLKNYNISVKEWNDDILFLRKIVEGPADRSYGIHVGRLAGLPEDVVNRAKEILFYLESGEMDQLLGKKPGTSNNDSKVIDQEQLLLFQKAREKETPVEVRAFLKQFEEVDPLSITPMEAMNKLYTLVNEFQKLKKNSLL